MNNPTQTSNTDPEMPPEVVNRRPTALTPFAAEVAGAKEYQGEDGRMKHVGPTPAQKAASAAVKKARQAAEAFAGPAPQAGLTPEQVQVIKDRGYTGAPVMSSALGDRTPAFVNWLWAHHPQEAAVRYAYREVWPTALPANWPPKVEPAPALAAAPRTYTQAEVDMMLAAKQPPTPIPAKRRAPRKAAPAPAATS